ncbi:F-box/LRR-repeat protein At3g58900-like [Silene latifolia]|uniref:F-box/LRR-repeat protein At3g58900-like n=1 Tax=Silene latifolia TaxID=37657 RepID=UPI003D771087
MGSSMKLGKHVEDQGSGNCLDRISTLPNELLGHILSFLPTKCAVITSVLSTRWRYLFTLTTCLSFEDEPCFGSTKECKEIEAARKISFKAFVDKVLELHKTLPINKFRLICRTSYDNSDYNRWVSTAVQKGVQDLHYQVSVEKGYLLPNNLVMCETLVRLELRVNGCEIKLRLPTLLPKLKILHLENVDFFDYDSIKRLFSGCKLLEEFNLNSSKCDTEGHAIISSSLLKILTIDNCCFEKGLFEFDAPNLAHLSYSCSTGVKIILSWNNSCSLVTAELRFDHCKDDYCEDSLDYELELLSATACKATSLCFSSDSIEILLMEANLEEMPDFHKLSTLNISGGQHCPYDDWRYVTGLLEKSPQLETIYLHWDDDCLYCDPMSCPVIPEIPDSCPVKLIKVDCLCGHVCLLRPPFK